MTTTARTFTLAAGRRLVTVRRGAARGFRQSLLLLNVPFTEDRGLFDVAFVIDVPASGMVLTHTRKA